MKRLSVLFVVALAACGPAVNGTWKGPPLVTLAGQLTVKDGLVLERGVRLAIAWYPNLSGDAPAAPRAIVTEEVEYTGVFPQRFTFPLHAPPAVSARERIDRGDLEDGEAAVGQLLAYEDLDGDRKLTVDALGRSVDRILGSSAGAGPFDFYSSEQRDLVAWVRHADDLGLEAEGMKPGYNLLRFTSPIRPPAVLPLDTSIPLQLTGDPRFALITCPEAYADTSVEVACGVTVWSTPEASGNITLNEDGALDAFISVPKGASKVTLNGTELFPSDDSGLVYTLLEQTPSVLRVGVNTLVVEAPGYQVLTLQGTVPARFDVLEPVAGARLTRGAKVHVAWTPSTGATLYSPSISVGAGSDSTLTDGLAADLMVPMEAGSGELVVSAFDRLAFSRAALTGLSVRVVPVQVE